MLLRAIFLVVAAAAVLLVACGLAEDQSLAREPQAPPADAKVWPHWRGPTRDGHSPETSGYRPGQPWLAANAAWQREVGLGATAPLVADGSVFTMGWQDGRDTVVCIDTQTAEQVWAQSYECPKYGRHATGDEGFYGGPTSTPEFDPETGFLYTLSTDGDLHCWDARNDGRPVWSFNLIDRYNVPQRPRIGRRGHRDYGYTTSPLLFGDELLVEVGSPEGLVMGFNKQTGERLWTSQAKGPAGHTGSPALLTVEGKPCLATLTIDKLVVMRLDDKKRGRTIGEFPWATDFSNNIAGPAVAGDSVIITSAYNKYAICRVQVALEGLKELWQAEAASKVCTPVVHEGHLYWTWQKVHCLDLESGREVWTSEPVFGDAGSMIVTADDRLIVWARQGTLLLAETAKRSPEEFNELARREFQLRTDAWPHIALGAERLYCKDRRGMLICIPVAGR